MFVSADILILKHHVFMKTTHNEIVIA